MEELLMCSVCIERYHETKRHPVLLPRCGHSFCRPCIAMLVNSGCIVCPTCRTDQRIDYVERLPTEYTLLAIINAQENNKKETCDRHRVKLSFYCRTCSIATCGECLFEDHPTHSHDVIRAAKYIEDMKQSAQQVAVKFIKALDEREKNYYRIIFNSTKKISSAIRSITVLRKDMEEARELMKGIKEDESITAATSLSEAAKFLGLKWNIQDANFSRQAKEELMKDEIELEKERAQEAFAKEEEKKTLKDKEKTKRKEGKRVLKKSKTLSAVELHKEAANMSETEKLENEKLARKSPKESVTEIAQSNGIPDGNIETKSTEKLTNNAAIKIDAKPKETEKLEDSKQKELLQNEVKKNNKDNIKRDLKKVADEKIKEIVKQNEFTIKDIIRMKSLLKKTDDSMNLDKAKDAKDLKSNNKLEVKNGTDAKLKETVIPQLKETANPEEFTIQEILKIKEFLKRTEDIICFEELKEEKDSIETNVKTDDIQDPTQIGLNTKTKLPKVNGPKKLHLPASPIANGEIAQAEALPAIQEKNTELPNVVTALTTSSSTTAPTTMPLATLADEVPSISKNSPETIKETVPEMNGNNFSSDEDDEEIRDQQEDPKNVESTTNTMNADSGLAEDSREKKIDQQDLVEDGKLVDFIQVPGFMICVEAADGRLGSLVWGPQGLHVHCLQYTHVEYDIVIRDNILNTMIPSKNPTVFFELTADQTVIGRVYIKLWGHLRRAQNFLSLCLGDQGKSYLNTKFLQVYNVNSSGERILGGDYESNNGRGGKGLLDDLEWNGDYAMPMKAGMITAAGSGQSATNSLFLICTQSDASRNFSCPFGLVCEGLKVVKDAVQQTATKQIWITDCGVVIVPPSFDSPASS